MAKQRHNIDSYFRQHLPDYEATQSSGNWDLLNHLLNEQEQKRKNRKWIVLFLSLALILSGSWFVYHLTQQRSSSTIQDGLTNAQQLPGDSPEKPNGETSEALNPVKQIEQPSVPTTESRQLMETGFSERENKVNTDHEKPIQNKNKRNEAFRSGQKTDIQMSPKSIIPHGAPNSALPIVESSQSEISISNAESLDIETQNVSTSRDSIQLQEKESLNKINNPQEAGITKAFLFDSSYVTSLSNDSSALKVDTQLQVSTNVDPIIPTDDVKNFNVSTGVNVYNTSEAFTNNKNIAALIGVEYTFHLAPRWSVGLGAWYSPQGGYSLKDTTTQETYFFDHVVSQQAIHINRLHKLYFPLSIYHKLSNAHLIGVGIQPAYLLNTWGNYIEIQHTTTSNSRSEDTNVNGYMDGIKPVTFAMHLAYKYKLSKSLDFGLRLSRELTGAFEREYFFGINTKPSWSAQALIHFNF